MKLDMSKQNGNADYFGFVQVCLRLAEIKQVIWWQDDVLPSCSALCVLQTFSGAQNCVYKIIIISQSTFLCLKVLLSAVTGGQSTQECVMCSFLIPSCALLSSSSCCLVARVVSSYVTHLVLWICEFNSCHCQQCWCGFFFFCFFFFFLASWHYSSVSWQFCLKNACARKSGFISSALYGASMQHNKRQVLISVTLAAFHGAPK